MHARRPTRASHVRSQAPVGWKRARGKVTAVHCKAVASPHIDIASLPQPQAASHFLPSPAYKAIPLSRGCLQDQHILVLGKCESGTAATKLVALHGAKVLGLDEGSDRQELWSRTSKQIPSELQDKVTFDTMRDTALTHDDLQGFDLVVLADGISVDDCLPYQALARGVPVTSELALAAALLPASVDVVCVTGNSAKSTTTVSFLDQMMTAMEHRVWSGGDSSRPLSALAYETATSGVLPPHFAVVEVSPSQLEPEVFSKPELQLTVTATAAIHDYGDDQVEREESWVDFLRAKQHMMNVVTPDCHGGGACQDVVNHHASKPNLQDVALIGGCLRHNLVRRTSGEVYLHRSGRTVRNLDLSPLQFPGSYNRVAANLAVSLSPGEQQLKKLQACITHMVGLPSSMELVHKDVHGVSWFDDSVSTSVWSLQLSLEALETLPGKAVVMLGGSAQSSEEGRLGFNKLAPLLKQHKVIAFGASAKQIMFELEESGVLCETFFSLKEAVEAARKASTSAGLDTVVLSPGCDSFDEFVDDADRAEKFTAYVTGQL